MDHATRRAHGSGSIYRDGNRWVAALPIPTSRGERRRVRRRTRQRFCDCLRVLTTEVTKLAGDYSDPDEQRRARLADARKMGAHTEGEWWALVRSACMRCAYCGTRTTVCPPANRPNALTKDHRVPLARGGSDGIVNLAVSCRACNAEKATMTATEYIEWRSQHGR